MSLSSRLYERAQSIRHLIRQRLATWAARRHRDQQADELTRRQVHPMEPRLLLTGSIGGRAFADANENGLFDSTEQGLAGWTVYLDQNQNLALDSGETSVLASSTGAFAFDALSAATYSVRAIAAEGWTVTAPASGSATVELEENEAAGDIQLGYRLDRVIDNGAAGHSTTGSQWWSEASSAAYGGQALGTYVGSGSERSTWTAGGLPTGFYAIQATWPAAAGNARDAGYAVFDGTASEGTRRINQSIGADDVQAGGHSWEQVGVFHVENGELRVELTNEATSGPYIVADAIRIVSTSEPTPMLPRIIDESDLEAAQTGSGWWWLAGGHEGDVAQTYVGSGADRFTWTFKNLPDGYYEVQATWTASPGNALDAPYSVADGAAAEATRRINQQLAPDDEQAAGRWWERLGVFHVESGELRIDLSDQATSGSYIVADAIRVVPTSQPTPPSVPRIVDETDLDAVQTGAGWWWLGAGYHGDVAQTYVGSGADRFTWTFENLADGYYEVQATWTTSPGNALDAPFTLFDGAAVESTPRINQQLAPDDEQAAGRWWERLGIVHIVSGELRVELSDQATSGSYIVADAIRVLAAAAPTAPPLPRILDETDPAAVQSGNGWWWLGGGYQGDVAQSYVGSGGDAFTWTIGDLPDGYYEVQATWTAGAGNTLDASFKVFDGNELKGTRRANQRLTPDDATIAGLSWERLGVFYIQNGTMKVELSDAASSGSYLIADAIRVLAADPPLTPQIIDESDLQATLVGNDWWWFASTGSIEGDAIGSYVGGGSDRLTWTFTSLAVGTYDVYTRWPHASSHTLAAPFTVLDGSTVEARHRINQARQPQDVFADGAWWKYLGAFDVGSGQLSVEMTDQGASSSYAVGDAVRITPNTIAPPSPMLLDEGDPGTTQTGAAWGWSAGPASVDGDYAYTLVGQGDTFSWDFSNLTTGLHEVYVSYPFYGSSSAAAPYRVLDGGNVLATVLVNQQVAAGDILHGGVWWKRLGVFSSPAGTLSVELSDLAASGSYVSADAAWVRPAVNVTLTGAPAATEGSTYTLDIQSYGSDSIVIDWGDGTAPTTIAGTATQASHIYADGFNQYLIEAEARAAGLAVAFDSRPIDVLNAAPSLSITQLAPAREGAPVSISLAAADPGDDQITTWLLDFGDGSPATMFSPQPGEPWVVTHTYADGPADFEITAAATDEDGTYSWAGGGASPGTLDPAFGGDVRVTAAVGTYSWTTAIVVLEDGRSVVAGSDGLSGSYLARLTPQGVLDDGFGSQGIASLDLGPGSWEYITDIAVHTDGAIVVTGYDDAGSVLVGRVLHNGALDVEFGSGGVAAIDAAAGPEYGARIFALAGGELIIAGTSADAAGQYDFSVIRLTAAGTHVTTWGNDGIGTIDGSAGAYDNDWTLDALLQLDGKIVLTGYASGADDTYDVTLVRFNADGTPDAGFGSAGVARQSFTAGSYEYSTAIGRQSDGGLLVAGFDPSGDLQIVRFTTEGNLDTSFGVAGRQIVDTPGWASAASIRVDDENRILIAGSDGGGDFFLTRLLADGGDDLSFGAAGTGRVHTDFGSGSDTVADIALGADGLLYAAGSSFDGASNQTAIARYFVGESGLPVHVENVAPRVTVTGNESTSEGHLYTLTVNDIIDPGDDTIASYRVYWGDAPPGAAGEGLYQTYPAAAGNFTHVYADGPAGMVIRVEAIDEDGVALAAIELDGSNPPHLIDHQAAPTGLDDPHFHRLASVANHVITAGSDWSDATGYDFDLRRFLPDGRRDTSWSGAADFGGDEFAKAVAVHDNKLIVAGYRRVGGEYDIVVARFDDDGSLDETFGTGGKVALDLGGDEFIYSLAVDAAGRILLAGSTSIVDNGVASRDLLVVRLTSSGQLDETAFGVGGVRTIDVNGGYDLGYDIVLDGFGGAVIVGASYGDNQWRAVAARIDSAGNLDACGFGVGGVWASNLGRAAGAIITSATLASGGLIVLAGHEPAGPAADTSIILARLHSSGSLDTSFGAGGIVAGNPGDAGDSLFDVAIDVWGRPIAVGTSWNSTTDQFDVLLLRMTPTGLPDDSFGGSAGVVRADWSPSNDLGYGLLPAATGWLIGAATPHASGAPLSIVPFSSGGLIQSAYLTVTDVVPTLTITGSAQVDEAATYDLDVSAGLDPSDTIDRWIIDWGDGSTSSYSSSTPAPQHVYQVDDPTLGSQTFVITASAENEDGVFIANALIVEVANLDPAPTALSAAPKTDGSGSISLSWTAAARASFYSLYRAVEGGNAVLLTTSSARFYVDPATSLGHGQSVSYFVISHNANADSDPSNSALTTIWRTTAVVAPTPNTIPAPLGLTAALNDIEVGSTIELSWQPVAGAGSYLVYRRLDSGAFADAPLAIVGAGGEPLTFVDTDLIANRGHFYQVRAVIDDEQGPPSNSAGIPRSPAWLSTVFRFPDTLTDPEESQGGHITLGWEQVPDAAGYRVYRSTTPHTLGAAMPDGTQFDTWAPGETFYYRVTALDATAFAPAATGGEGLLSIHSIVLRNDDPATPQFNRRDGLEDDQFQFTWTAVPQATGYDLSRFSNPHVPHVFAAGIMETTYSDNIVPGNIGFPGTGRYLVETSTPRGTATGGIQVWGGLTAPPSIAVSSVFEAQADSTVTLSLFIGPVVNIYRRTGGGEWAIIAEHVQIPPTGQWVDDTVEATPGDGTVYEYRATLIVDGLESPPTPAVTARVASYSVGSVTHYKADYYDYTAGVGPERIYISDISWEGVPGATSYIVTNHGAPVHNVHFDGARYRFAITSSVVPAVTITALRTVGTTTLPGTPVELDPSEVPVLTTPTGVIVATPVYAVDDHDLSDYGTLNVPTNGNLKLDYATSYIQIGYFADNVFHVIQPGTVYDPIAHGGSLHIKGLYSSGQPVTITMQRYDQATDTYVNYDSTTVTVNILNTESDLPDTSSVNDDDDDEDGIPDRFDGYDVNGTSNGAYQSADDANEDEDNFVTFTFTTDAIPAGTKWRINYAGHPASIDPRSAGWALPLIASPPVPLYSPGIPASRFGGDATLRLWRPVDSATTRSMDAYLAGGDLLAPGHYGNAPDWFTAEDLGLTVGQPLTFHVEALDSGLGYVELLADFPGDAPNVGYRSIARHDISVSPATQVLVINNDDSDNDGIVDFADGFNRDGLPDAAVHYGDDRNGAAGLTWYVAIPTSIVANQISFQYDMAHPDNVASEPGGGGLTPGQGTFRLWGFGLSNTFIAPGAKQPLTAHSVSSFTLEAVNTTSTPQTVTATFYDGDQVVFVQTIPIRAIEAGFAADVDQDGDADLLDDQLEHTTTDYRGNAAEPVLRSGLIVPTPAYDLDGDGLDDYADGYDFDGVPDDPENSSTDGAVNIVDALGNLQWARIDLNIPETIDLSVARVRIFYPEAAARHPLVIGDGSTLNPYIIMSWTSDPGDVRLWKLSEEIDSSPQSPLIIRRHSGTFYDIDPGFQPANRTAYLVPPTTAAFAEFDGAALAKLGINADARSTTLFLEGLRPSSAPGNSQLELWIDPDGTGGPMDFLKIDELRYTVGGVATLHIDSLIPAGGLSLSDSDDRRQIVLVNDLDVNAYNPLTGARLGNGYADFNDGYTNGHGSGDADLSAAFVPVTFKLNTALNLAQATVGFRYTAADPGQNSTPEPGALRLWKGWTGDPMRDADSVTTGGDFIPAYIDGAPGTTSFFTAQLAPNNQPAYEVTLYLEAVRASSAPWDQVITLMVDPDGPGHPREPFAADAVAITAVSARSDNAFSSAGGVNLADGSVLLAETDLALSAGGTAFDIGRVYSNQLIHAFGGHEVGNGWSLDLPYLLNAGNALLLIHGATVRTFDVVAIDNPATGVSERRYAGRFGDLARVDHAGGIRIVESDGAAWSFHAFTSSNQPRATFDQYTDARGQIVDAHYDATGRLNSITRANAVSEGPTIREELDFTYTSPGPGLIQQIEHVRTFFPPGALPQETILSLVQYDHAGQPVSGQYAAAGDLKSVSTYLGDSAVESRRQGTTLYRYEAIDAPLGITPGPSMPPYNLPIPSRPTLVVDALGYERAIGSGLPDPNSEDTPALARFASYAFDYDLAGRVEHQHVLGAGPDASGSPTQDTHGKFTFDYIPLTPGIGNNSASMRTIETAPGNLVTHTYTNSAGQTLLTDFQGSSSNRGTVSYQPPRQ